MAVPYSLSKAAVTDILQCPDTVVTTNLFEKKPTIFLAGGISNCPNWQEIAIAELKGLVHGLVINPRRDDFDTTNPAESMFQIHWEHKALEMSDILMFWFPHDTLCPITLFELGKYLGSDKKIIIGADPEYARLTDVQIQSSIMRPNIQVHSSLEATLCHTQLAVMEWHANHRPNFTKD